MKPQSPEEEPMTDRAALNTDQGINLTDLYDQALRRPATLRNTANDHAICAEQLRRAIADQIAETQQVATELAEARTELDKAARERNSLARRLAFHFEGQEKLRRELEAMTAHRDRLDREATTWKHRLVSETAELRAERDEARASLRDAMAELRDRTAEARGAHSDYNELKGINADLANQRDEALEARNVLRHQLDTLQPLITAAKTWRAQFAKPATTKPPRMAALITAIDTLPSGLGSPCRAQGEPAEVEVVELSGAEWDAACRAGLARLGLTYAQMAEQARTGRLRDPEAIKLWPTVKGRPELDLPAADLCAQGIRPADWQQRAIDAAQDGLGDAWSMLATDPTATRRLATAAVSAIIDAGLAGAGGRCPTCGETYPRTMPAGEDQRCWTCSTEEVAGLPEYGGGEQSLTDRLAAALKRLMRINAGEGVPVATWDEWEHLLAQHAANATPPTELTVSSTIAVPSRFARAAGAAHGQNDARDWVRLYTGSGRQYEGYRSQLCPGDGVAGHQHDVRCIDQAED